MLGVFNRVAGISDCSGLAPRANIIGIAGISITKNIASILVIFDNFNWLHFFLFLTKFRAFENGCWKTLGVFNRVAGISDCSGLAPRANIIGIAGISITKSIASIFVIFDNWLHFFLFLTNIGAMENSCWESHGVLNRVACVSDSSSCAPRALGIISIAGSVIFMCLAI